MGLQVKAAEHHTQFTFTNVLCRAQCPLPIITTIMVRKRILRSIRNHDNGVDKAKE